MEAQKSQKGADDIIMKRGHSGTGPLCPKLLNELNKMYF